MYKTLKAFSGTFLAPLVVYGLRQWVCMCVYAPFVFNEDVNTEFCGCKLHDYRTWTT